MRSLQKEQPKLTPVFPKQRAEWIKKRKEKSRFRRKHGVKEIMKRGKQDFCFGHHWSETMRVIVKFLEETDDDTW